MILKQKLKRGIILTLATFFVLSFFVSFFFSFDKKTYAANNATKTIKTTCTGSVVDKKYTCTFSKLQNSPNAKYQVWARIANNNGTLKGGANEPKAQSPVSSSSPITWFSNDPLYIKADANAPYVLATGVSAADLNPSSGSGTSTTTTTPTVTTSPAPAPAAATNTTADSNCAYFYPKVNVIKEDKVNGSAYQLCADNDAQKKALKDAGTKNINIVVYGANQDFSSGDQTCVSDTKSIPINASQFDDNGCFFSSLLTYSNAIGGQIFTESGPFLCNTGSKKPKIDLPSGIKIDCGDSGGSGSNPGDITKQISAICKDTSVSGSTTQYSYTCSWKKEPGDGFKYEVYGKQEKKNDQDIVNAVHLCSAVDHDSCQVIINNTTIKQGGFFTTLKPLDLTTIYVTVGKKGANEKAGEQSFSAGGDEGDEGSSGYCPTDIDSMSILDIFGSHSSKDGQTSIGTNIACVMAKGILAIAKWINGIAGPDAVQNVVVLFDVTTNQFVNNAWRLIRNFINALFVISFLIAAAATVISPLIKSKLFDNWKIQRMVPTIVGTVFMVNFSLAICSFLIAFANALCNFFLNYLKNSPLVSETSSMYGYGIANVHYMYALLISIAILIMAFIFIYIYIVMWVRVIVINLLVIFSAVPYVGYILPIKSVTDYTGRWWGLFIQWLLMAPIICLFLYLTVLLIGATGAGVAPQDDVIKKIESEKKSSYLFQEGSYRPLFATATNNLGSLIGDGKTKISAVHSIVGLIHPQGIDAGTIKVNSIDISNDSTNINEGTAITIIATPKSGYKFKQWESNSTFPNITDPTNSTLSGVVGTTDIVVYALFESDSGAALPNAAAVDDPTGGVNNSGGTGGAGGGVSGSGTFSFLNLIMIIVMMYAGISFSVKAAKEAGKVVDQGIKKATGGKVEGVGAGLKMAGKGVASGAKTGLQYAAGREPKSRLGKLVGGAAGGILTAAGAPKAIVERQKGIAAGYKKKWEDQQKKGGFTKWVKEPPSTEFSDSDEKFKATRDRAARQTVDNLMQDISEDLEKGKKKDLVAHMAGLKEITMDASRSEEDRKTAKQKLKQIMNMVGGGEFKVGKDIGDKLINFADQAKTDGTKQAKINELGGKLFVDNEKMIDNLANVDITNVSSLSKALNSTQQNKLDAINEENMKKESLGKIFGGDFSSANLSDIDTLVNGADPANLTSTQALASRLGIVADKINSDTIKQLTDIKKAFDNLKQINNVRLENMVKSEEDSLKGYMNDVSVQKFATDLMGGGPPTPIAVHQYLSDQVADLQKALADNNTAQAEALSRKMFNISKDQEVNIKDIVKRLDARKKALDNLKS